MDGWRDLWIYTMGIERRHKFLHCLPIVVLYFDLRESHSSSGGGTHCGTLLDGGLEEEEEVVYKIGS